MLRGDPLPPNYAVVPFLFQVWNQKSEAAIDQMFHPDGKAHGFPDPDSLLVGLLSPDQLPARIFTASTQAREALDDGNRLLQNQAFEGDALVAASTRGETSNNGK
jgi:hypothetical protein